GQEASDMPFQCRMETRRRPGQSGRARFDGDARAWLDQPAGAQGPDHADDPAAIADAVAAPRRGRAAEMLMFASALALSVAAPATDADRAPPARPPSEMTN